MPNSTRSLPNLTSYAGGLGMIKSTPAQRRSFVLTTAPEDALGNTPAVIAAWNDELRNRIHVYHKNSVEEFLDIFAPPSKPYAPSADLSGVFSQYEPRKGGEVASYPALIGGLDALTKPFPESHKLTFADTHSAQWRFPFHAFSQHHSKSSPDISVSFPGSELPDKPTWSDVAMCIEVKPTEGEDPFPSWKAGSTHNDTISQVARNARNLLITHGFLQTFVVGIYANTVRIARFDHTSGVVSQAFNLKQRPDLLQRFFWHFTHPVVGNTVIGCDPTVHPLTLFDQVWIRRQLFGAGVANVPEELSEIDKGRRAKVYNERTGKDEWYLLIRLLDVNTRLLSRATAVWLAVQDTREYKGDAPVPPPSQSDTVFGVEEAVPGEVGETLAGEEKETRLTEDKESHSGTDKGAKETESTPAPKVRVLKEAWRQLVRTPELAFYERLDACIPDNIRWGLPKFVCGTDLGEREVRLWESECPRNTSSHFLSQSRNLRLHVSGQPLDPPTTPFSPSSSPASSPTPSRPSTPTPLPPAGGNVAPLQGTSGSFTVPVVMEKETVSLAKSAPFPQHQTFTWALSRGVDYTYRERSHMRLVVDELGRPLTEFKDTRELVRAVRDAVMGHRLAWEEAGVMQRDISLGNILIVDDPAPDGFVGFIHDFDYSAMTASPPGTTKEDGSTENEELLGQKERTGTFHFMPIDLLTLTDVVHDIRHDLESFYWVILWVVLRHTEHSLGQKKCREIFVYAPGAAQKINWLGRKQTDHEANMTLTIKNNKPLTTLMAKLRLMARDMYNGAANLTYDKVLEVFNAALAEDGWPADDWVPCTLSDEVVDSVVSPFQFAPDHHADHLVRGPVRSADEVAMAAYRDAFAKGKEREATTLKEVMDMKKRKNRSLGRHLDALNAPSGAPSGQRKRRKVAPQPRQEST